MLAMELPLVAPMLFSPWYQTQPLTVASTKGKTCWPYNWPSHHGMFSLDRSVHTSSVVLTEYSSMRWPRITESARFNEAHQHPDPPAAAQSTSRWNQTGTE